MKRKYTCWATFFCPLFAFLSFSEASAAEWTSNDLHPIIDISQSYSSPNRNASVDGMPLTIHGETYDTGIGGHADCTFTLSLDGEATRLTGLVGIDDETAGRGEVICKWYDDSNEEPRVLWESGTLKGGDAAKAFDIPLKGITKLRFFGDKGENDFYDHIDIVNLKIEYSGKKPEAVSSASVVKTDALRWVFKANPGEPLLKQVGFGIDTFAPPTVAVLNYPHRDYGNFMMDETLRVIQPDGSHNLDLRYDKLEVKEIDANVNETTFFLKDLAYPITAELVITAYKAENVFTSELKLHNNGEKPIEILARDAVFLQLPNNRDAYLTSFTGEWAQEMTGVEENKISTGVLKRQHKGVIRTAWPDYPGCFISFDTPAEEESGEVFGAAFAWTGSWQYKITKLPDGRLFYSAGVPDDDLIQLLPGETYTSPRAVLTYSDKGIGQASRNFQNFGLNYNIYNSASERPVVLNTWEGAYFTFDEPTLIAMMDGAQELGIEMFVLDDGWFGNGEYQRNGDNAGLGDWQVNTAKLPHGLEYLIDEAEKRGMKFGLWVEPEMVNPASNLFHQHPEWVMAPPNRDLRTARNQYVLDLSQPAVEEFVYQSVANILTEHPRISYIKWDHNCVGLNVGSATLGTNQGALSEKHTAAYYRIMERLRKNFPGVQFQLCSSGAGRTDMGSMHYSDEFWGSDETNAIKRIPIQWGWSHFFPSKVVASHIGKYGDGDFKLRADVAMTGRLGVELSPATVTEADRAVIRKGIDEYKKIRPLLHTADLYRGRSPHKSQTTELTFVSKDKKEAVFFGFKRNTGASEEFLKMSGLKPDAKYNLTEINPDTEPRFTPGIFTGKELMEQGLAVKFPEKPSSVVVKLTEQ